MPKLLNIDRNYKLDPAIIEAVEKEKKNYKADNDQLLLPNSLH